MRDRIATNALPLMRTEAIRSFNTPIEKGLGTGATSER
jgi:hypothetical protein